MTTVLHVSDLHFGEPAVPVQIDAIEQLIEERGFDVVVISGDLSQRARPGRYTSGSLVASHFTISGSR